MSRRVRCSVMATSRPSACSGYSRPSDDARIDPALAAAGDDPVHRRGHGDREFARHRLLVEQLDAVDGAQALAGVGGAPEHQGRQLDESLATQPAEVDHPGQGVERLGGADVRRGLLAADVLLAGLQGQHEAALAVQIARLPGDSARDPADQGLAGGEEAKRRAAEVQAIAERLALADRDVDAALARGLEQRQGVRVTGADRQRPDGVSRVGQRLEVLDRAEEVRLLRRSPR